MRAYSRYQGFAPAVVPDPEPAVPLIDRRPRGGARGTGDVATLASALEELEAAKLRVERGAQQAADDLRAKVILELIPLIDDLERTIRAAEEAGDAPAVLEGVRLVHGQFLTALERHGVVRVDALREAFDPALHEAISTLAVPHPAAHNVVIEQVAPGYKLGERLLRPARVVVGRHTPRWY